MIQYDTIQYDVGERGGHVVTVLGDLQYDTIQYNTTWGNVEDTW